MKKIVLAISLIFIGMLHSQDIENNLDIQLGGHSLIYSFGFGSKFSLKDSSQLGFRLGMGIAPIGSGNLYLDLSDTFGISPMEDVTMMYTPSLALLYSPHSILRGKSTFSFGVSLMMIPRTYASSINIKRLEVTPWLHLGFGYNVLKKHSKSFLTFGLDLMADFNLFSNSTIVPWPKIVYGFKL
ncbi:MAG: hypothetical protein MUE53_01045 [Chitinophagales bacterium]|jgi:hypothetical protein|nr:hypothetical protein [Chitinophagales bacterium]